MRIEICNLNNISGAEIDLKPLTILIGPNNMGKTWLAYVISGILSRRGCDEYATAYARDQLPKLYPLLDIAIEKVLAEGEGNAAIDLYKLAEECGETYFQNVAEYAKNWMNDYFATQLADFSALKVCINVADIKADLLERVEKYSLLIRIAGGLFTIRKERGNRTLYAFTSIEGEEQLADRLPVEEIKDQLVKSTFRIVHRSLYRNVRMFPTERTTLVTLPLGSRVGRKPRPQLDQKALETLEILEKALREVGLTSSTLIDVNARATTGPVSNFMNMMSAVFRIGSQQIEERKKEAKKNPNIQKYIDLADILEKQILTGELELSTLEPEPKRDILFQAAQDITLEIPIASSMVKELAPLVLYLRYLAEPEELIVIDEPEMNLHPAAQMKLIEFLAMLVNAGLDVLMTTHSSYLIDHLSNLIDAYKHRNQDEIVDKFLLEQKEAFISQERVSVYFVMEGEVKDILDSEGIIDWKTFSDVTRLVERIHFELLGE